MKIQIDFDNKVIKLESNVNLKEFYDKIKLILEDWKEYSLHTNTTINWAYPAYTHRAWPYAGTYYDYTKTYGTCLTNPESTVVNLEI